MNSEEARQICRKLKPFVGSRADALYRYFISAANPRSKYKAESLINTFAAKYIMPTVDTGNILLPPPSNDALAGEFPLGQVVYGEQKQGWVSLLRENYSKHIAICSITGGGKTNVSQIMLLSLLRIGIPFLVVDWKRSYRDILSLSHPNISRVRVYTVGRKTASPFHWSPLRPPPAVHPQTWLAVLADALEKSHISGQGVADIFIEILDKRYEALGFYSGKPDRYPNFHDALEEAKKLNVKGRRMLWRDSLLKVLRSLTFGPGAGAFNARHPIKLEQLLDEPVIVELDQELPKPLRVFFSEVILRWIHLYRLSQGETDQLRGVLFLEEAHNLFPRSSIEREAVNSIENIFREVRGFGQGIVMITQHPSVVPVYILGNSNTQIYLGLQHEDDIIAAKRALFLERGEEVYLDRLKVGEGIVKIKGRVNPCFVRFPLVPVKKGSITDSMISGGEQNQKSGLG